MHVFMSVVSQGHIYCRLAVTDCLCRSPCLIKFINARGYEAMQLR